MKFYILMSNVKLRQCAAAPPHTEKEPVKIAVSIDCPDPQNV